MAWRIHDSVRKGEIDNCERGLVKGRLWLHGIAEPVALELSGNANPDLAGCRLIFENPGETVPLPADAKFDLRQRGTIGDLTASRKVRVLDESKEEFVALRRDGKPAREHWANCLYLEWFSEANGRVVVESHEFKLNISEPAWRLTPEEEQQRQRDAAAGFAGFMDKLSEVIASQTHVPPPEKEWDEFDYEKLMRESDARTDKYMELLDKYEDHPDRERIIAREMEWEWFEDTLDREDGSGQPLPQVESTEPDPGRDETKDVAGEDEDEPWLESEEGSRVTADADAAENLPPPDPATEGIDWVRDEDGNTQHPLTLRAFNGAMTLWRLCEELDDTQGANSDLDQLVGEYQTTGAKLAGALDSLGYGRDITDGAFIVACLKRALNHLHNAQAALEKVATQKLLPATTLIFTRDELFQLREEILRLMEEFRGNK